jgi:RNA ligase
MTLHYQFPVIRHINDVLPHVKDSPEFVVVERDDYTVVNYIFMGADTFPRSDVAGWDVRRECRGLLFTPDGGVLARRFHKFFNLHERDDMTLDIDKPHYVLEKLDGSMVSPIRLPTGLRWTTKMGVTEVAMQAEMFIVRHPEYEAFADECLSEGWSPIFEWCSRQQRIVLDYDEDRLTLLAVRHHETGQYRPRGWLVENAARHRIPTVGAISGSVVNIDQFVGTLREREDIEGVVITFDDGHMVKIKTDWYVQIHRAKDRIARERRVVEVVLDGGVDDLLPVLPEKDRDSLLVFASAIAADLAAFANSVAAELQNATSLGWDRKAFALSTESINPAIRAACFTLWDRRDEPLLATAHDWATGFVRRHLANPGAFEKARGVLKTARWKEQARE